MATAAMPTAHAAGVEKYRWLILLGLITAAVMEVLDTTIVNVALPQRNDATMNSTIENVR